MGVLLSEQHGGMISKDVRCRSCNKLLAKGHLCTGFFEIKCARCGVLNSILEQSGDQVIVTNSDGTILYANDNTETITGYSLKEIIGSTPALWGNHMSKAFYKDIWDNIKNQKKSVSVKVKNKTKQGQDYEVYLRVSPILDTEGNIQFFVGISTKISK